MTDKVAIPLAFMIVAVNGLIGHFLAPNGITLTPIVLIITSSLIAFWTKNTSLIGKALLIFACIALNDILIKLYSGGRHDHVGLGWILVSMFMGLVPAFGILLTAVLRYKGETMAKKSMAIGIFLILVAIHLYLFADLGLGRSY